MLHSCYTSALKKLETLHQSFCCDRAVVITGNDPRCRGGKAAGKLAARWRQVPYAKLA